MGFHCSPAFLSLAPFMDWQCDAVLGTCHVCRWTRTCPLLGVHGFSGIPHNSCSASVKWCKMCVKTGQRTFPDSPRACRAQVPCAENFFFHEVLFAKPPSMVCIQHCPFWSKQNWEQFYSIFKKKIALGTHTQKNPIPWWINEGSPRTDIICMLSFFNAVAGENNSMPACYPEICCAKANSWQQVASREGTKVFDGWVFLPQAERSICEKLVIYCGWNGPFTG